MVNHLKRNIFNLDLSGAIVAALCIRHVHISHNAPYLPPKFCITAVFHFSWVLKPSQEKLKAKVMQILGGKKGALWGMWKWRILLFSELKNLGPGNLLPGVH